MSHISDMRIPYSDFKNVIRSYCKDQWQDHWSGLTNNSKMKSIMPSIQTLNYAQMNRRTSIVLARLRIGHTYLTHKYLMASGADRQVPVCSTCHVDLTVKHILVECNFYENRRRANSLSNLTLSEILDERAPVEQIMKFLKEINLFYDI